MGELGLRDGSGNQGPLWQFSGGGVQGGNGCVWGLSVRVQGAWVGTMLRRRHTR